MILTLDPEKRAEFDALIDASAQVDMTVPRETDAPSWWHGDEEAYASSMRAFATVGNN